MLLRTEIPAGCHLAIIMGAIKLNNEQVKLNFVDEKYRKMDVVFEVDSPILKKLLFNIGLSHSLIKRNEIMYKRILILIKDSEQINNDNATIKNNRVFFDSAPLGIM